MSRNVSLQKGGACCRITFPLKSRLQGTAASISLDMIGRGMVDVAECFVRGRHHVAGLSYLRLIDLPLRRRWFRKQDLKFEFLARTVLE